MTKARTLLMTLTLALPFVASPKAQASGVFLVNLGYLQGTFTPVAEAFPLRGPYFTLEAGYQVNLGTLRMAGGLISRYSELKYTTNGLTKAVRWYYTGLYGSVSYLVTPLLDLKIKFGYAPYSKLFVFSNNSLTINDQDQEVKEYSMYSGGRGLEFTASALKRWPGAKKYDIVTYAGLELGFISQDFTNKNQKTVIQKGDEEPFETKETASGAYKLGALMLSFPIGVEF